MRDVDFNMGAKTDACLFDTWNSSLSKLSTGKTCKRKTVFRMNFSQIKHAAIDQHGTLTVTKDKQKDVINRLQV